MFAGEEHPTGRPGPQGGVRAQGGGLHPCRRRAGRVSQSEVSHLFDVNAVVEEDQVSSLLLAHGRGRVLVRGGGGTARLGGVHGAAGADGNWTGVSPCWVLVGVSR